MSAVPAELRVCAVGSDIACIGVNVVDELFTSTEREQWIEGVGRDVSVEASSKACRGHGSGSSSSRLPS